MMAGRNEVTPVSGSLAAISQMVSGFWVNSTKTAVELQVNESRHEGQAGGINGGRVFRVGDVLPWSGCREDAAAIKSTLRHQQWFRWG